jgi:hypothetical protein
LAAQIKGKRIFKERNTDLASLRPRRLVGGEVAAEWRYGVGNARGAGIEKALWIEGIEMKPPYFRSSRFASFIAVIHSEET